MKDLFISQSQFSPLSAIPTDPGIRASSAQHLFCGSISVNDRCRLQLVLHDSCGSPYACR